MSGIPSVIIRFICHLPLGFLASNGLGMYNNMKGLGSIYGVIPGGRSFLEGARIIGGVGWPLFAYNFVCFALTGFLEGLWLATIGLIDLVFTVTLIAGVAKQADFLPRTYDGCRSASDWRNGSDGRNFFHEAIKGDRWNGYRDPGKLCHGMVQNWAFCIAVIIIYGMSASINLTIGLREHYHDQNASRYGRRGRSAIASRIPADLWVLRPATVMVRHFVPGLRFLWQYAAKVSARWRSVAVPRYEYHQQLGPLASSDAGGEPRLPFKVTSLLAMELHFAELVSLAKSSKQMRGMLLGTKDPAHELEELRSFTCAGMDKAQCRICDAQVCNDCDVVVSLPRTLASQHLETCQPCCTKCFYTTYCAHTSTTADSKRHEHKVSCVLGSKGRDEEEAGGSHEIEKSEGSVCRTCAAMSPRDRKLGLEARDTFAARRLAEFPMVCGLCRCMLPPSGPRWWTCSSCQGECPSDIHPPWRASS